MTAIEERAHRAAELLLPALDTPETLAARRGLREQVTALHEELRQALQASWAPETLAAAGGAAGTGDVARLLDLGELETVRDGLLASLGRVREAAARRAEAQERARALLDAMYADPAAHRGVRLTTDDLGLPGCCRWQVRPVLGVVGRLAGWWRVRVSSGCP
ncbi:hypothetical protein [Actinomycetospora sp. TBRC 11914]|uniref:hypothetical protein n=1 Tax=Actinomycetospora sp. TBRC 11914 TaxID=2729387 RepID=UPI00145F4F00|nr:hypothetical protein [Actinomycetospora sp. TBRC 11914]NMO91988.1 hypothetical protein [Actinomycetospora sp. TBRC 11914]